MNSFGTEFRISIFGESHSYGVGITIDGCPPGLALNEILPVAVRVQKAQHQELKKIYRK